MIKRILYCALISIAVLWAVYCGLILYEGCPEGSYLVRNVYWVIEPSAPYVCVRQE